LSSFKIHDLPRNVCREGVELDVEDGALAFEVQLQRDAASATAAGAILVESEAAGNIGSRVRIQSNNDIFTLPPSTCF
jgi:hypothetical protein